MAFIGCLIALSYDTVGEMAKAPACKRVIILLRLIEGLVYDANALNG